ncbi:MAG TPA: hypothetical protein VJ463_08630 [Geothrix sp.]|nr:hypothetical protein [Geothrix sp.]
MRPFVLMALMALLCGILAGQNATIAFRKPDKEPETLAQLARKLTRDRTASWVLLEGSRSDPRADWVPGFRKALVTDDELSTVGLPVLSLGSKSPLASELRVQQGWGTEARWVLMASDGRTLESEAGPSNPRRLADLLAGHGIQGKIRELEVFLAKHPGHLQAQETLLGLYLRSALVHTGQTLNLPPPKEADGGAKKADSEQLLSEAEDQAIWGKAAKLLERVIQSGDWRLGPMWTWAAMRYPTGRRSPLMQEASRRALPIVEEALRQHPGHYQVWAVWAQLAENAGGRSLRNLMDSITPVPGDAEFVPESILTGYIQGARGRGDWASVVDLLGPRWEQKKEGDYRILAIDEDGLKVDALKGQWDGFLKPLVEAHLRLGSTQEADRIVRDAMAWMPSKGLPGWASALAAGCGQPALAAQWAAIPVPKG